jgi:tetratricopeptide (TPR) repeat protein
MSQQTRFVDFGRSSKYTRLLGLSLMAVAFAAYWPALQGAFIWDDDSWTTKILHLLRNARGLYLIWFDPTALQQYYPLSGTTFWLDYHFWKLWALPYHVENVVLHLIAVLLFWRLLQKLQVPGAWLAAGIFALHPAMVESVAWITERKNVLSMVFFLGALLAYGRFNSSWKTNNNSPRRWGAYALAFVLLLAALLAKTTTFSFPAVILLIGWWKNGRIRWRAEVLPALPFFAVAIGLSLATAWLEKNHVGATGWEWNIPFPERCLIAGRAFWFYLGKLLCPANLCFIYPRWQLDAGSLGQWLYPAAALATLGVLWVARKKIGRGPATAAFFFVGTLFPVLGFMDAYGMRYSFVWDHWVYLSSLGIFALGAALITHLAGYLKKPAALFGFAAVLLPVLAILTWKQSAMYSDLETLWQTTIAKSPTAFLAYNNLGYILMEKGRVDDAIPYFNKSLEINPNFNEPHNNLGDALLRMGQTNEAVMHFQKAVDLDPTSAASYYNLGDAWLEMGRANEAITQFQKALELDPGFARAYNNLGVALLRIGRTNKAAASFQKAIEVEDNPVFADAYNNLANVLAAQNRPAEAIEHYQKAIQINPNFAEAHCGLADLLAAQGRLEEAIEQYQKVVQINPDYVAAHYNLGVVLARQARLDEAAAHFRKVIQISPASANAHGNLANVLVGQGKLDEAVGEYHRTLELEPNSAQAHYKLGLALQTQRNFKAAITECQRALELDPRHLPAHLGLAWLLATSPDNSLRNGEKAVKLAVEARALAGIESPQLLDTLAAAYAEAGRFSEAVETARQALNLNATKNDKPLAEAIQSRLKLYETHSPYHEKP